MDVAKFQNRKDKRNVFPPYPAAVVASLLSADTFFILHERNRLPRNERLMRFPRSPREINARLLDGERGGEGNLSYQKLREIPPVSAVRDHRDVITVRSYTRGNTRKKRL